MKKISSLSLMLATTLFGAGYQIPNSSINSVALATANVANANGADAAYFNPARMTQNKADIHQAEASLSYVMLTPMTYEPAAGTDIESNKITSTIPAIHFASANLSTNSEQDIRFGLSVVIPAGLTRAWDDMPANATSKKYALETIELNPSIGIKLNDAFSIGAGVRYIKGSGEVELDGSSLPSPSTYTLDMKGDGSGVGMNFALSYQATSALNFSATYRTKVLMNLTGDADVTMPALVLYGTTAEQTSRVSLDVPIPANALLGVAYAFESGTTLEFVWDRTFWSIVQDTDFDFSNAYVQNTSLETSKPKEWTDSDSYRVGVTQKISNATLMAGLAYNKNPAPDQYVSFASPETDTLSISFGGRYLVSDNIEFGLATLYNKGYERTTSQPTNLLGMNGTISDKDLYVVTAGVTLFF
jgi:long-chain fatty acid transport protein